MKKIYEFTLNKEDEIEQEEVSTNDAGEQVKTIKKIKKEIPHKFFLKFPSRAMRDEASLFYGVEFAKGTKAGLLTIPLLDRRNINDGGVFSEKDKAEYLTSFDQLIALEKDFQALDSIKEADRTEDQKTKHKEFSDKVKELRLKIQEYETFKTSIYDHTAEVRARNQTITWWLVQLAYKDGDKPEPFFGNGTYEERLNKYDEFSESGEAFVNKVMNRFLIYVSFWAANRANLKEDFDKLGDLFDSQQEVEKPA